MFIKKFLSKIKKFRNKSLEKFSMVLYHYGGYVYDRPYAFIFSSLLCCLVLIMGFYYKDNEKNIYRLYSISNSYAYETNQTINNFFLKSRKSFILIESNCNLLEPDILRELKKFEDGVKDIKLNLSEINECNKNSYFYDEQNDISKELYKKFYEKREQHMKILKNYELNKYLNTSNHNFLENNRELLKHENVLGDNNYDQLKIEKEEEKEDLSNITAFNKNNMLKGSTSLDKSSDIDFSDYKDDNFYPHHYIPPLLDKGDYCDMRNVFKDKNLNINLREASNELKKQIFYGLEDICEKKNNTCNISSLFSYYENGNSELEDSIEVNSLDFYINMKTSKKVIFRGILGNMKYTVKDYKYIINSANAILTTIPLLGSYIYEPYVLVYEKELIDYVRSYNINDIIANKKTNDNNKPFVNFHVFTERSLEDEVDRISKIDKLTRLLFILGVILIFIYALFNNVTSVLYRSKPLCSVMGVICGFLGFLAGSGFLYFLGVKSVPPAETVPFLVIGVGVDDIFVLLNSYSLLFMIKDDKKRIQMCLRDSALSITITTLTNIIAFLISAISPFYSICSFSLFTASSLFFGYLMVLTFFFGFLCIEAKLERKKKNIFSGIINFFCFFRKKKTQSNTVLELQHNEEPRKESIEYENISIYEWIHNLYLFEESIDKKKMKAAPHSSNEKSIKDLEEKINEPENLPSIYISEKDIQKKASEIYIFKGENCEIKDENTYNHYLDQDDKKKKTFKELCSKNLKKNVNIDPNAYMEYGSNNESIIKNKNETLNDTEDNVASSKYIYNDIEKDFISNDNFFSGCYDSSINSIDINEMQKNKKSYINNIINCHDLHNESEEVKKKHENKNYDKMNSSIELATKDTFNITNEPNKKIYLLSSHDNALFYKFIYKEPKGNIGKCFRSLIKNYYIPFLSSKIGKAIIYIIFSIIIALSIYGCTLMKKGINYDKAFPEDSYVRQFTLARIKYFQHFGNLIEVFYFDKDFINKYNKLTNNNTEISSYLYSDRTDRQMMSNALLNKDVHWENTEIQTQLMLMHEKITNQDFVTAISNGFMIFLMKHMKDLNEKNSKEFYNKFTLWMKTDFIANIYEDDFIFLNEKLVAWRFNYLQVNIDNNEIQSKWLRICKDIAKIENHNIQMVCFHMSEIFNETDEAIIEVTLKNLGITIVTILIVTSYIVKGLYSCLIIALIIFLIDLCIFGFMCLCGITVNIISMVILILSVGFSIDHTTHIVQAFTHSLGKSRAEKMKESLHLMIGPVLHSGLSTWFIISTLFFSNKDFTIIFFQTLTLVLSFSIIFSTMLLPVLLFSFGPL